MTVERDWKWGLAAKRFLWQARGGGPGSGMEAVDVVIGDALRELPKHQVHCQLLPSPLLKVLNFPLLNNSLICDFCNDRARTQVNSVAPELRPEVCVKPQSYRLASQERDPVGAFCVGATWMDGFLGTYGKQLWWGRWRVAGHRFSISGRAAKGVPGVPPGRGAVAAARRRRGGRQRRRVQGALPHSAVSCTRLQPLFTTATWRASAKAVFGAEGVEPRASSRCP